jgi:hypothetical protein
MSLSNCCENSKIRYHNISLYHLCGTTDPVHKEEACKEKMAIAPVNVNEYVPRKNISLRKSIPPFLSIMLHRKMPLYPLFLACFHIPYCSFPYILCWTHGPHVISHYLSPHQLALYRFLISFSHSFANQVASHLLELERELHKSTKGNSFYNSKLLMNPVTVS